MNKPIRTALLALFALALAACGIPPTPPNATATLAAVTPLATALMTVPVIPTAATPLPTLAPARSTIDFDGQRALEHVRMLAGSFGMRSAATASGRRAGEYLNTELQSYGYDVSEQHFPFLAFSDKATQLAVVAPVSKNLGATPLIYSPSGHVKAQVLSIPGVGRPEDYSSLDVKGKIVMVPRGQIYLRDKARNAAQAGAAAVLIYSADSPGYVGTLQERGAIPTVVVSTDDARELLTLIQHGPVTLQLDTETEIGATDGINIVATRSGTNGDTIVFGAHYDSVHNSPGADDNGSGVAIVLELARVLAQANRPETLVFIGFDAEEPGLIGSQRYVYQLSNQERRRIKVMLDFDELGTAENRLDISGTTDWVNRAVAIGQRLGANPRANNLGGSDHDSFLRAGIPALFFYREDLLFHTPQDTPDRVRAETLQSVGRIALELLDQ